MSTVVVHQAWFELLAFWRSARGRCFTLALPVKLSAIVLAAIVGAGSFASLGYALASLIRSSLLRVAAVFPVRPLAQALYAPLDPAATGAAVVGSNLRVVARWRVAGLVIATLHFSWAPRS
jgi:hypothetical protein